MTAHISQVKRAVRCCWCLATAHTPSCQTCVARWLQNKGSALLSARRRRGPLEHLHVRLALGGGVGASAPPVARLTVTVVLSRLTRTVADTIGACRPQLHISIRLILSFQARRAAAPAQGTGQRRRACRSRARRRAAAATRRPGSASCLAPAASTTGEAADASVAAAAWRARAQAATAEYKTLLQLSRPAAAAPACSASASTAGPRPAPSPQPVLLPARATAAAGAADPSHRHP